MYVKYKCDCITDTNSTPVLSVHCPEHGDSIKDWSSVFKSPYRVVIHWHDGTTGFAMHKVGYDQYGFPKSIDRETITPVFPTTADLAHEARRMGFTMEEVSDIFYDRYLEYREFFPEEHED